MSDGRRYRSESDRGGYHRGEYPREEPRRSSRGYDERYPSESDPRGGEYMSSRDRRDGPPRGGGGGEMYASRRDEGYAPAGPERESSRARFHHPAEDDSYRGRSRRDDEYDDRSARGPPPGNTSSRDRDSFSRGDNDDDRRRSGSRRRAEEEEEPPRRRPRRSGFSSEPPPGAAPPPSNDKFGGQGHLLQAGLRNAPRGPHDVVSTAAAMGLVPIVPDATTKPRRELFVGNTPPGVTERMLVDHLNAAMATMKMSTAPGAPVVQCRVSANFAFVELRSIEETDRALSLTGIPFMGNVLKIGRPSKYSGPGTPSTTWQQLLLDGDYEAAMGVGGARRGPSTLGGTDGDGGGAYGPPSSNGGMPAQQLEALLDPAAREKVRRELFVGNTSPLMTETAVRTFLGRVARQLGLVIGPGDPIISLRLSGHYCFVELRSVEETDALLSLNGVPFLGSSLRIGRPSKYAALGQQQHQGGLQKRDIDSRRWEEVLDDYRHGRLQPLEIRGDPDALGPPTLTPDDVDDLARVPLGAARAIKLFDLVADDRFPLGGEDGGTADAIRALSPEDAANRRRAIVDGVVDDVKKECGRFGPIQDILIQEDKDLVVVFNLVDTAVLALATLRFKTFDGKPFRVEFLPEPDAPPVAPPLPPDAPGVPAPPPATATHPPLPEAATTPMMMTQPPPGGGMTGFVPGGTYLPDGGAPPPPMPGGGMTGFVAAGQYQPPSA